MYRDFARTRYINVMKKQFTPAIDLLLPSAQIIKQNILTYFVLAVLPMLLYTPVATRVENLNDLYSPYLLVGMILAVFFYAPLIYTQTHTAKGKDVNLKTAFLEGYKYFWRLVGLNIIFGAMITIGFLAFIVPGVILLRRYFLSFFYLVDQDLSIKQALNKSAEASSKRPSAIYGVVGVTLLFAIFGGLSAVGAAISQVLLFLYSVAPALRYAEFKSLKT